MSSHCRTGYHQHTCSGTHWHGSLGVNSRRCPRAHCCWHLASVAVGSQRRWFRADWHMALHTRGSLEVEERAGHPLSRSVLTVPLAAVASASSYVHWCRWADGVAGRGSGHPLCSLTPSVSSALLQAERAGLKRGPEGQDHQSLGSSVWHPLLARHTQAA